MKTNKHTYAWYIPSLNLIKEYSSGESTIIILNMLEQNEGFDFYFVFLGAV